MKKICFLIAATLISAATFAQTAKSVLDKAAANITVKSVVQAKFKMTGSMGNTSGTIAIKGRKFHATTPQAIVWFDGKTQWTYMKNND
jgi:outer membrane lipoprotein-sorting protein